jgi:hypothetical protein
MKTNDLNSRTTVAALALSLVGLSGCIEYTVETTLAGDGSGVRREEMVVEVGDSGESGGLRLRISDAEFGQLMHVGKDDRWRRSLRVEDGDTFQVFERETRLNNLAGWAGLSGAVRITGATSASAGSKVGRIRLGDVHFRNSIQVETGNVPAGQSYTFRETFYWENLLDALVEWYAGYVKNTIGSQYPDLTAEERGEIIGFVKGGLWAAIDRGLLDASGDEEDQLMTAFVNRASQQSLRIVRQRYPNADPSVFERMLRQVYEEEDQLEEFIAKNLPGVELAANSEVIFRLVMPGRVMDSNAHDQDGAFLVWKFGPGDAVTAPVEIFAQSVVEQQ